MEISEQTLVDIIRNQGMQTQAFIDMKDKLDKVLPYLDNQHKDLDKRLTNEHKSLEKRVRKVEKKVWYGSGIAAALAFMAGFLKY